MFEGEYLRGKFEDFSLDAPKLGVVSQRFAAASLTDPNTATTAVRTASYRGVRHKPDILEKVVNEVRITAGLIYSYINPARAGSHDVSVFILILPQPCSSRVFCSCFCFPLDTLMLIILRILLTSFSH